MFIVYSLVPSETGMLLAEEPGDDAEMYTATVHELPADVVYTALNAGGVLPDGTRIKYHEPSELDCMCASTYHPYGAE